MALGLAKRVHVLGSNGKFGEVIQGMSDFTLNRVILFKGGSIKDQHHGLDAFRKRELIIIDARELKPQDAFRILLRGICFMSQIEGLHLNREAKRAFMKTIPAIRRFADKTLRTIRRGAVGLSQREILAAAREEFFAHAGILNEDFIQDMFNQAVDQESLFNAIRQFGIQGILVNLLDIPLENLIHPERKAELLILSRAQTMLEALRGIVRIGNLSPLTDLAENIRCIIRNISRLSGKSVTADAYLQAKRLLEEIKEQVKSFEDFLDQFGLVSEPQDAERILLKGFDFTEHLRLAVDELRYKSFALKKPALRQRYHKTIFLRIEVPIIALHDFALGDPLERTELTKDDFLLINTIQALHQRRSSSQFLEAQERIKQEGRFPADPAKPREGRTAEEVVVRFEELKQDNFKISNLPTIVTRNE